MDAQNDLIPMVEDDQGEGVKDPIPDEMAEQMQKLEEKLEAERMKGNEDIPSTEDILKQIDEEEEEVKVPWLPKLGTKFTIKLGKDKEREYHVTYLNQGRYRFSAEPTDKSYMK